MSADRIDCVKAHVFICSDILQRVVEVTAAAGIESKRYDGLESVFGESVGHKHAAVKVVNLDGAATVLGRQKVELCFGAV